MRSFNQRRLTLGPTPQPGPHRRRPPRRHLPTPRPKESQSTKPMTPNTRTGFHRLGIFAAALAGSVYFIAITLVALDHPGAVAWRVLLFLVITTPLVSALALLLIRGIAWVCAGFARHRGHFSKPNWN